MKTINAATPSSRFASSDLKARRFYDNLDTAAIKRQERRKSRRHLDAELRDTVARGIQRDKGMSRPDVMEAVRGKTLHSNYDFQLAKFLVRREIPLVERAITVIRKRTDFRRPQVETLMVLA